MVVPAADAAAADCTAADFVDPSPVAFTVSMWSASMTVLYDTGVAAPVEVDYCVFICLRPLLLSQFFKLHIVVYFSL